MPARRIDIAALKARLRAACEQRGIDPLEGATSFQVVHLLAEQSPMLDRPAWWQNYELWNTTDDPIRHSLIEELAINALFFETWMRAARIAGENALPSTDEDNELLPLRERLAEQGVRLVWVDLGDGETTSIVRPLKADESISIADTETFVDLDDMHQRAIKLRLRGETYKVIAQELCITESQARSWCRKYFDANRIAGRRLYNPPRQRIPADKRAAALEMAAQGLGTVKIGRALGVNSKTVWRWLKQECEVSTA